MTVGKFLRVPIESVQLPANTATRLPGFDSTKSEAVVETIIYFPNAVEVVQKESKKLTITRKIYKNGLQPTKALDNVASYRQITNKRQFRGN